MFAVLAALSAIGTATSPEHLLKGTDARTRAAIIAAVPDGTPEEVAIARMAADGVPCFDAYDDHRHRASLIFCRKDETRLGLFPWSAQIMFLLRDDRTSDVRVETGYFLPSSDTEW